MKYVTEGYEPALALRYFEELARIPRGSYNEKAAAQWIYNWGKERGLDAYIDDVYNVILKKKGSPGCENLPPIALQAHTDMVCAKLPDVEHDFEKDGLDLYVDDKGQLRAKGTTLGCDDGYGVAYIMAILDMDNIKHPPIEAIFTVGEEVGLIGAEHLDPSKFSAKRMINLDGGGERDQMIVSSAGGLELKATKVPRWQPAKGEFLSLYIYGLKGGHSAGSMNKGRRNAAKLMARILYHVSLYTKVTVAEFDGGG